MAAKTVTHTTQLDKEEEIFSPRGRIGQGYTSRADSSHTRHMQGCSSEHCLDQVVLALASPSPSLRGTKQPLIVDALHIITLPLIITHVITPSAVIPSTLPRGIRRSAAILRASQ